MTKACIVNAGRLDFDGRLDFSVLEEACGSTVTQHDDHSPSPSEIATFANGMTTLVTKEVPVDVSLLPDSVKLICEAGTGFNNIDLLKAKERGITVCNVPSYSTDAVAQLVMTSVLNFSMSIHLQLNQLAKGDKSLFHSENPFKSFGQLNQFELANKTIGLIGGTGAIGLRTAALARAFGMRVLVHSRSAKDDPMGKYTATKDLKTLLENSDFVSIHCPLNESTKGMINAEALSWMKPTAYLINTARGAIINENDLINALKDIKIAGAALDVQHPEPPAFNSPLFELSNVVLTPHVGWKRVETRQRLMDTVAENVKAYLSGKPMNVVN